jgi:hypothetical protein
MRWLSVLPSWILFGAYFYDRLSAKSNCNIENYKQVKRFLRGTFFQVTYLLLIPPFVVSKHCQSLEAMKTKVNRPPINYYYTHLVLPGQN